MGPDITDDLIDLEYPTWHPGDELGGWVESEDDKTYGSGFPDAFLVSRSEWRDRIELREQANHSLKRYHIYVYNQSPESSCVYNSANGCLTIARNLALGLKHQIITSPMAGYGQVASYRHSGSTMWGALQYLKENGTLPSDGHDQKRLFHHTFHENTPFSRKLPDGWQKTARHFRVLEWFRIDSREQFASALLNDMPICYGRSGHSICAEDLIWDSDRNKFLVSYCDSYGLGRGRDGRLYDSEGRWATGGAWCPRAVTLPHDPQKPAGDDGK